MKLADPLPIPISTNPIKGSLKLPGSKSITNRALIIAALAKGKSKIKNPLLAEDTQVMLKNLNLLGISIEVKKDYFLVQGKAGKIAPCSETLLVEGAGTAARFLIPLLTLGEKEYLLDGNARMRQRPIKELVQAMQSIGCPIKNNSTKNSFPLKVISKGFSGGEIEIDGSTSSQFISALMLTAPYAKKDTKITIKNGIVSFPYIEMTRKMMETFGAICQWTDNNQLFIPSGQCYQASEYFIEGDASTASYFLAMAAITQGEITLSPLFPRSLQGDLGFLQILKQMGCEIKWGNQEVTLKGKKLQSTQTNLNQMSDLTPTLAVTALFAEGSSELFDIYNLRFKESDRLTAIATELTKLGVKIKKTQSSITISSLKNYKGAIIDTYQDHRMAMAFSLCGLKIKDIFIKDPSCVAKTFPDYWKHFFKLNQ